MFAGGQAYFLCFYGYKIFWLHYHCSLLIAKITRQVSELRSPSYSGQLPSCLRHYSSWEGICKRREMWSQEDKRGSGCDLLGVKDRREGRRGQWGWLCGRLSRSYVSVYNESITLRLWWFSWVCLTCPELFSLHFFPLLFNLSVLPPISVCSPVLPLGSRFGLTCSLDHRKQHLSLTDLWLLDSFPKPEPAPLLSRDTDPSPEQAVLMTGSFTFLTENGTGSVKDCRNLYFETTFLMRPVFSYEDCIHFLLFLGDEFTTLCPSFILPSVS